MVKSVISSDENILKGFSEIVKRGIIKQGNDGYTVVAEKKAKSGVSVRFNGKECVVNYSSLNLFYYGFLYAETFYGDGRKAINIDRAAERTGVMIDCSRNAVMNVSMLENTIVNLALAGYSYIELYTEDTYEIDGEPYFGYQRGRYTAGELSRVIAFAELFGIEIIPCIQTLAHLNCIFNWDVYADVNDIDDILLAENEKTYALIEKMIAACAANYKSRRIHIGMDEAYKLGRGKYQTFHGLPDRSKIMRNHLKKVVDLCHKYGFRPQMWCDMFFQIAYGTYRVYERKPMPDYMKDIVPEGLDVVYWEYYSFRPEFYDGMLGMLSEIVSKERIMFGGGMWKWSGFAPQTDFSVTAFRAALPSVKKYNVSDILITAWGDNGGECAFNCTIGGLLKISCMLCGGSDDECNRLCKTLTGYTYDEFFALDLPDKHDYYNGAPYANPSKMYFYNDLLLGLFDYYIDEKSEERYKGYAEKLFGLCERNSRLSYLFDSMNAFCAAIGEKCGISYSLWRAYKEKDKKTLCDIAFNRIPKLIEKLSVFNEKYCKQWFIENKPFGYEVVQTRLVSLKERCAFAEKRVKDYLSGKIEKIEELEDERLKYFGECEDKSVYLNNWARIFTPSVI